MIAHAYPFILIEAVWAMVVLIWVSLGYASLFIASFGILAFFISNRKSKLFFKVRK